MNDFYIPLMIFFAVMGVVAFVVFGIDKHYAVNHKWRVKEATLFTLAILGGALGALAGMLVFHHKTNKPAFQRFIPLLALVEAGIILVLTMYRG